MAYNKFTDDSKKLTFTEKNNFEPSLSSDLIIGSSLEAAELPGSDPAEHLRICLILDLRVMPLKSIYLLL